MKLHALRYFSVLAEELHFGRAAQRLAITQPPLSGAIKALEDELGTALFTRDSKHVALTPAGEAFRLEVGQILERLERAAHVARAVAGGARGRLDVGVTGALIYRELPQIMAQFEQSAPGVALMLREMSTVQQIEDLLRGQLSAGFVNAATVPPQLACLPLAPDRFVCCLPQAHPLASRQQVRLQDLAQERFVMFAREVSPANYDNVAAIFSQEGIHPRMVHAARQWLTVLAMVARGLGVSLVPRSLMSTGLNGVAFVALAGVPKWSHASLVWNPAHTSVALESFLASAQAVLKPARPRARRRAGSGAGRR